MNRLVYDALAAAKRYRARNPITRPQEPKQELSERVKRECLVGQRTGALFRLKNEGRITRDTACARWKAPNGATLLDEAITDDAAFTTFMMGL